MRFPYEDGCKADAKWHVTGNLGTWVKRSIDRVSWTGYVNRVAVLKILDANLKADARVMAARTVGCFLTTEKDVWKSFRCGRNVAEGIW